MTYVTKYADVEVEVEVELDDFSNDDLIEECQTRNIWPGQTNSPLTTDLVRLLHDQYTTNKDITETLRQLFDTELGRIV